MAKLGLVDVALLIGGGEDLALVDVIDLQGLEDLGLHEMADPGLGHDRDGDALFDLGDHLRVRHAGHPAVPADIRGHPLQGHDGHGARLFGDLRLFHIGHVHDHAALEHLGELDIQFVSFCIHDVLPPLRV